MIKFILALLILTGVIFQNPAMIKTGGTYDSGVGYWGPLARDGVWHEALVGQILRSFPPDNPGLAGLKLTNYHYFYDLSVAGATLITGIAPSFFIYRFFPIVFSVLLGLLTYLLAWRLFKSKLVSLLAVFFAYFGSSFGWIVEYIKRGSIWAGESAFWANQPVSMNLNPPFAISLVLLIGIILMFLRYQKTRSKVLFFVLSLLSGTLIGFKVYAGILVLFALAALSIEAILVKKNFDLLKLFGLSLIISAFVFLPQASLGRGLIEFKPLWLIDSMIDAGDRVGIPNFTARRFAYLNSDKWLHLFLLETLSFLMFVAGNLGTRVLGVFWAFKIWKKELFKLGDFCFIFWMSLAAFLLPILFIQKGNTWNTIQFFYYFLYFSSLFTAYALGQIYEKLPKAASVIIIGVVLVITPISSIATFRSWLYPNPPAKLTKGELAGLEFLKEQEDGVVLKHPFDPDLRGKFEDPYPLAVYADNAYVSAYSGKPVFIEDVEQQIVLGSDYKPRLENAERFFIEKNLSWSNDFLKENNIKYVYLPEIYFLPIAEQEYIMRKIFENEEVNIYRVLQ